MSSSISIAALVVKTPAWCCAAIVPNDENRRAHSSAGLHLECAAGVFRSLPRAVRRAKPGLFLPRAVHLGLESRAVLRVQFDDERFGAVLGPLHLARGHFHPDAALPPFDAHHAYEGGPSHS